MVAIEAKAVHAKIASRTNVGIAGERFHTQRRNLAKLRTRRAQIAIRRVILPRNAVNRRRTLRTRKRQRALAKASRALYKFRASKT